MWECSATQDHYCTITTESSEDDKADVLDEQEHDVKHELISHPKSG